VAAGLLLGVLTWFYAGSIGEGGLAFARVAGFGGFATTLTHSVVGYALLGVLVGLIVGLLAAVVRREARAFLAAALTFGISIGLFAFARAFVEKNLGLPSYVPLESELRSGLLRASLLAGALWGAVGLAAGVLLFLRTNSRVFRTVALVVLVVSAAVSFSGIVGRNIKRARHEDFGSVAAVRSPGKVVVIGLDGATWQFLDVLSQEGLTPNLDRLRRSGVTANLVTHGRRISPAVWTGMATGWSHMKHGIVGFTVPDRTTGRPRVLRSTDRLKPALWQIASEFGRVPCVINWWASYPAEHTNGVIVSRLLDMDLVSVSPPELLPAMAAIADSQRAAFTDDDKALFEGEAAFDMAEYLVGEGQPDLLMVYVRSTDVAQHVYWAALEPELYDDAWGVDEEFVDEGRRALRRVWSAADARIGDLLELLDDDTAILVLSDHGFKPRTVPLVLPRPDDLLYAMGYVEWADAEASEVDYSRSRAYAGGADASSGYVGVYVNAVGRQETGIVPPDSVAVIAQRIADQLAGLRIEETGEPVFASVGLVSVDGPKALRDRGADVYARKGSPCFFGGAGRTIRIGGRAHELDEFLRIHTGNSGNHDPRGVFIGSGPGFASGAALPLVAESPYTRALTYVTGYEARLEGVYRFLRFLGVLDPYTSIDVAPTVLYLLGLPASSRMEGRLMDRVLSPDLLRRRTHTLVPSFEDLRPADVGTDATVSEETLEALRALGYIQ
jgi:predicted AlkP superfamily phosphohydrolase/phosphomutase